MDDKKLHEGAKFDPMTGEPIESKPKFDPMTGKPLEEAASNVEEAVNKVEDTFESSAENVSEAVNTSDVASAADTANTSEASAKDAINQASASIYEEGTDSSADAVNSYNAFMRGNDNKEEFNLNVAATKVKRKGKGLIAGIVAGVLVIAGGVTAFAFRDNIVNKFKLMTMSSSEYYRYIIQKESDDNFSDSVDTYKYVYDLLTSNKMQSDVTLKAEAGDDVMESLKTLGVDTYGVESASIGLSSAIIDNTTSASFSVDVNDTRLATGEAYLDLENLEGYARIPELSESYLDISGALKEGLENSESNVSADDIQEALSLIRNGDIYPSPKVLQKEIEKYRDVYLDYVVDKELVKKDTKEVSANGISEKDTVLKVSLDGDEVIDLEVEYLEEVKKDDDLKDYFDKLIETLRNTSFGNNQQIEDFEIDDEIDKLIEDIEKEKEEAKSYKDVIETKLYVSAKGEIRGISITARENGKEKDTIFDLESITAIKNNKMGYKLIVKDDGKEKVNVKGKGNADFSDITANYTAVFKGGTKNYTVKIKVDDLDTTQYFKGVIKGKVTVSSDDIYKGGKLVFDIDNSREKSNTEVTVYNNDKKYAKLVIGTSYTDEPKSLKPDSSATFVDVMDKTALEAYVESIDIKTFVNDFTSKANITLDYDQIMELINKASSAARKNANIPDFNIGGDSYDDYDWGSSDFDYSEPSSDDYDWSDYDGGDRETENSYDDYDEDYWETYEWPTYDEDYWETYEMPTYDEDYWSTYDWDSLMEQSANESDV